MNQEFRFSTGVILWLVALGACATAVGLANPPATIALGGVGIFTSIAVLVKFSIRTRTMLWWWRMNDLPQFTRAEGVTGASGMALFCATIAVSSSILL